MAEEIGNNKDSEDEYLKKRTDNLAIRAYNEEQFDKQVIYLSGGGLTITMLFAKGIFELSHDLLIWPILFAWISFTLSLVGNLTSYLISTRVSDAKLYLDKQRKNKNADLEKTAKIRFDWYRNRVSDCNNGSYWTFVAGAFFFIVFISLNLNKIGQTKPPNSNSYPIIKEWVKPPM